MHYFLDFTTLSVKPIIFLISSLPWKLGLQADFPLFQLPEKVSNILEKSQKESLKWTRTLYLVLSMIFAKDLSSTWTIPPSTHTK